jgi:hypothetical protein
LSKGNTSTEAGGLPFGPRLGEERLGKQTFERKSRPSAGARHYAA